jgi:uncharacterized protein (TIGR02246 family)
MKKFTSFSFIFAAIASIALVFSSCQPAQPEVDLAQIKTEIQALEDGFANGMNAKDANAVVAYYANDAVSMPNEAPVVAGKDAILQMIQKEIAEDTLNMQVSFEVVDIFAAGDLAVETGKAAYKDSTGNVVRTSKYMSVFEKRDGKYLCVRDIYNKDQK